MFKKLYTGNRYWEEIEFIQGLFPKWTILNWDNHANALKIYETLEESFMNIKVLTKDLMFNKFSVKLNVHRLPKLSLIQIPLDTALTVTNSLTGSVYRKLSEANGELDGETYDLKIRDSLQDLQYPLPTGAIFKEADLPRQVLYNNTLDRRQKVLKVYELSNVYVALAIEGTKVFDEETLDGYVPPIFCIREVSGDFYWESPITSSDYPAMIQNLRAGVYYIWIKQSSKVFDCTISKVRIPGIKISEDLFPSGKDREFYSVYRSLSEDENGNFYVEECKVHSSVNRTREGEGFYVRDNVVLLDQDGEILEDVLDIDYVPGEEYMKILCSENKLYIAPRLAEKAGLTYVNNQYFFMKISWQNQDYILGEDLELILESMNENETDKIRKVRLYVEIDGIKTYYDRTGTETTIDLGEFEVPNGWKRIRWVLPIFTHTDFRISVEATADRLNWVKVGERIFGMKKIRVLQEVKLTGVPEETTYTTVRSDNKDNLLLITEDGQVDRYENVYGDIYISYQDNLIYSSGKYETIEADY